jgi:fibronectin-binding autotransporter adhesin
MKSCRRRFPILPLATSNSGYTLATGLTLNPNTGVTDTYSGAIANGAASMTLTKTGLGTQVLSGTNTYSGNTTISAGNLQVGASGTGSTAAGSAVSVNGASAVLSGTGTVDGNTMVTLGQISPGNSAGADEGTLTFGGALTFSPTSAAVVAALTIQGTTTSDETGDKIIVTGALTLSSNSFFTVTPGANWKPTAGQTWDLFDWGSITPGSFNAGPNNRTGASDGFNDGKGNLDLPDIALSDLVWDVSTFFTNGSVSIVNLAPEPSRALMLLLGIALALFRRRRPLLLTA